MYKVKMTELATKQYLKLDKPIRNQITKFIDKLENIDNPRSRGKPLVSNLSGLWRYRVGDYRLICSIEDDKILITDLRLGHRRENYD